jgi:hypothetical protein
VRHGQQTANGFQAPGNPGWTVVLHFSQAYTVNRVNSDSTTRTTTAATGDPTTVATGDPTTAAADGIERPIKVHAEELHAGSRSISTNSTAAGVVEECSHGRL